MKKYPKGTYPATFDPIFLADAAKLANGFLVTPNSDHGYVDFSRRLTICKENKDVNEVLLNYATSIAIFKRYQNRLTQSSSVSCRTDMPNFVPNPTQTPKALAIFRRSTFKNLPWVPSRSFLICLGIPKGMTMHFFYPTRASTCMRTMSHQQETGANPDWRINTVTLLLSQHWGSTWLLEGGPLPPCLSLHPAPCLVSTLLLSYLT